MAWIFSQHAQIYAGEHVADAYLNKIFFVYVIIVRSYKRISCYEKQTHATQYTRYARVVLVWRWCGVCPGLKWEFAGAW